MVLKPPILYSNCSCILISGGGRSLPSMWPWTRGSQNNETQQAVRTQRGESIGIMFPGRWEEPAHHDGWPHPEKAGRWWRPKGSRLGTKSRGEKQDVFRLQLEFLVARHHLKHRASLHPEHGCRWKGRAIILPPWEKGPGEAGWLRSSSGGVGFLQENIQRILGPGGILGTSDLEIPFMPKKPWKMKGWFKP